jgi:hypothetical protein
MKPASKPKACKNDASVRPVGQEIARKLATTLHCWAGQTNPFKASNCVNPKAGNPCMSGSGDEGALYLHTNRRLHKSLVGPGRDVHAHGVKAGHGQ